MESQEFSYSKPKVIQALRYHFISRREIKLLIIVVNLFAILAVTLSLLKKVSATAFLLSSIVWLFIMVSVWYILPYSIYSRSGTFKARFKVSLLPGHLLLQHKDATQTWPWRKFQQYKETPYFFHLYFNSKSFFLLPKDAFLPDQVDQARAIFRQHIGE